MRGQTASIVTGLEDRTSSRPTNVNKKQKANRGKVP